MQIYADWILDEIHIYIEKINIYLLAIVCTLILLYLVH